MGDKGLPVLRWLQYNWQVFCASRNGISATAVKVLAGQCLAVLLVVAFYTLFGSRLAVQSAAWGGVVAIVPAAYMAWRMARGARRGAPRRFLEAFYAGELGKWLLTLGLFYGLFTTRTLSLLPLLTGYGAALMVYWLALLSRRF